MPLHNLRILQVEDDSADVDLLQRALKQSRISIALEVVSDGEEALDLLAQIREGHGRKWPDLILLDLNLPNKDGHELLSDIKKDPQWKLIPVIILTNSSSPADVVKCYDAGAACYVTKSADFIEFTSQIKRMFDFWYIVIPPHIGTSP